PAAVLLVLGDAERELRRLPEGRAIEPARDAAEDVQQDEAERAPDRGVRAARVPERVVRRVHADLAPDRAVDDDHWCAAARARGAAVEEEGLLAHRLPGGRDDRE